MKLCWACGKNKTNRLIGKVPVCDACLLADSNGGLITKDYSKLEKPKKVIDKENEKEIALGELGKKLLKKQGDLAERENKLKESAIAIADIVVKKMKKEAKK